MNIESIKKYVDKQVKVGVPHHDNDNRLFYYYGTLKAIEDDGTLVLETRDGILFVDISQVKQFHAEGPWGLF